MIYVRHKERDCYRSINSASLYVNKAMDGCSHDITSLRHIVGGGWGQCGGSQNRGAIVWMGDSQGDIEGVGVRVGKK